VQRQIDAEGGAEAGGAGDTDMAAMTFDDAVRHRQAEAGALALLLGGEIGFKDPFQDGGNRRNHRQIVTFRQEEILPLFRQAKP
jgi:hypothetical protein